MEIVLTDRFKSLVKKLVRKYRRVADDVEGLVDDLENGRKPGDRIQTWAEQKYIRSDYGILPPG